FIQFVNWVYEKTGAKSLLHQLLGIDEEVSILSVIKRVFDDIAIRFEGLVKVGAKAMDVINYGLRGEFSKAKEGFSMIKTDLKDVFSSDFVERNRKASIIKPTEKATQGGKFIQDFLS
ncbi:hypothetical protein, partial [Flammeovirga sp. OC4]|uniref:hypothetical protein n=1 Tax=Flammeovirga sp. OC4 TaxID=1382345 RepID=UPI00155DC6D3